MTFLFRSRSYAGWFGGLNYHHNLFRAINKYDRTSRIWILTDAHSNVFDSELIDQTQKSDFPARFTKSWLMRYLYSLVYDDGVAYQKLNPWIKNVDVTFQILNPAINSIVPSIQWIPDFQHIHLPQYFTTADRQSRNKDIKKAAVNATTVMLSSHTAAHDFHNLTGGEYEFKTEVLPFVVHIPERIWMGDFNYLVDKYKLHTDFIYMPNQYWKHKNHKVVIDALKLLKERGGPIPYIVSSGGKDDYRNPDYFSELMNYLGENNLEDHYLYLGKIPYIEVLGLMKIAGAMINPSRFEGWATTVEEAKMLGQKLYLSDIDVHREQAPNATFFSPDSASELSALLQKIEYKENRTWDKLRTEWELKQLEYGKAFVKLTENTIARFYGT